MNKDKDIKITYNSLFSPELVNYYYLNPIFLIEDLIFGDEAKTHGGKYFVDKNQQKVIDAVWNNKRVTVRSLKGAGKTAVASWISIAWMLLHPLHTKVIMVGSSYSQLMSTLWAEFRLWLSRSVVREMFNIGKEKVELAGYETECFAEPRTAQKAESLQGLHASNLLIIADEASGIDDELLTALNNTLTSGENNKILLISNPTRNIGFFYNTHCNDAYKNIWKRIHLSLEDSSLIDKEDIEAKRKIWGEHHNIFRVDCLGEFPIADENSLFTVAEIEDSMKREIIIKSANKITVGVDVAREGNDLSVVAVAVDNKVFPLRRFSKINYAELAKHVKEIIKEFVNKYNYNDVVKVKIDATGMGKAVYDILLEDNELNIEPVGVVFGDRRVSDSRYSTVITEAYFYLKSIINKISLPNDNLLREELIARGVEYNDETGKIRLEDKTIFRNKYKRSPDSADAVVLAFYDREVTCYVFTNTNIFTNNVVANIPTMFFNGGTKISSVYYINGVYTYLFCIKSNDSILVIEECVTPNIYEIVRLIRSRCPQNVLTNLYENDGAYEQLSKFSIPLKPCTLDLYGQFEWFKMNVLNKNILILNRCSKLIRQLNDFRIDNLTKNIGSYNFCFSLMLFAELDKVSIIDVEVNNKNVNYDYNVTKTDKKIRKENAWMCP